MTAEDFQHVIIRIADQGNGMMRVYASFSREDIDNTETVDLSPAELTCLRFLESIGVPTENLKRLNPD